MTRKVFSNLDKSLVYDILIPRSVYADFLINSNSASAGFSLKNPMIFQDDTMPATDEQEEKEEENTDEAAAE